MARLKLTLLGTPRVERDGRPVSFDTRKAVALLAYLAVSGQRHGREALMTLFWPESDRRRGRSALRRTLSPLNNCLGGRWLEADNETIALLADEEFWLDVNQFLSLVESWRRHRHSRDQPCDECLSVLADAVALYCDDFMAGFTLADCPEFDNWQTYQRESLRRALADALERLVQGHAARQQYAQAIGYAQRWLAFDPLHEPAHRQLMLLYVWSGDRAAALRQYETCQQLLDTELGMPPLPETEHLHQMISRNLAPPPPPPPLAPPSPPLSAAENERAPEPPRHNLPARLTSFVGRAQALAAVARLLEQARLVTLTGPGGCGKTSLAVETARWLAENPQPLSGDNGRSPAVRRFDAVCLVELLPLADPMLLDQTLVTALGLEGNPEQSAEQMLIRFFAHAPMLLILDNCEHLVDAAAHLLETLLRSCPHLHVLVTSRERLNIGAETVYPVPPLAVPSEDMSLDADDLAHYPAVQLFVERSHAVTPQFRLTADNAAAILRICTLLDGLPLALELGAAATAAFTVDEIARQLEARQLLAGLGYRTSDPRHRRLSDTVEWSYNLLAPAEQRALVYLAVFTGGWTLEAMQGVLDAEADAVMLLHQLVRKSLVGVDQVWQPEGSRTRYYLLRAVREYAAARLTADKEQENVRRRHFDYYTRYATRLGEQVMGAQHRPAMAGLDADYFNIRTAVHFAPPRPHLLDSCVRMAAALTYYWRLRNHALRAEGLGWLQAALEPDAPCSLSTQALACGALLSLGCIDPLHSTLNLGAEWHGIRRLIAAGEALLAQDGLSVDPFGTGRLLLGLADAHRFPAGLAKCREYATRAVEPLKTAGDRRSLGFAYNMLTWLDLMQGNMQAVHAHQAANLRIAQESGSPWALCEAYLAQADLAGAISRRDDQLRYYKLLIALAEQNEFLSFLYACFHRLESIDQPLAIQMAEELAERQRSRPPSGVLGLALHQLGRIYINAGQLDRAVAVLDEAIRFWRRGSEERRRSSALEWSLTERGNAAYLQGRYDEALRDLSESIDLFAGVPFAEGSLWPHFHRGYTFLALADLGSAEADLRRCIELVNEGFIGWRKLAVWALAGMGEIAQGRGEASRAGALFGAAAALDSQLSEPAARGKFGEVQAFLRCMAAAAGYRQNPDFEDGRQQGERLTFEAAVALAQT